MKVALVYDRVNKLGGAERVLLALHEIWPEAPLYTSVYNSQTALWAKVFKVVPSFLQKFPLAKSSHEFYAPLMPLAFESFNFDNYDLVISVTSEAAKGIITKPKTLHICYCLTPTRYLWSGYQLYFETEHKRMFSRYPVVYLRIWDKVTADRPDYYLAISKNVQGRIKNYYHRESEVVYPPVETKKFEIRSASWRTKFETSPKYKIQNTHLRQGFGGQAKYYLVVSRLVKYKKVDLVVEVFNQLGWDLKIVGVGREMGNLREKAKVNIEFLGQLTDEELLFYYQNCQAVIFPQEEDFGIVAVEAQACGKPVIAFRSGGATETIVEGKTGFFFEEQTAECLEGKLRELGALGRIREIREKDCREQAEKFSKERFKKEFKQAIEEKWQEHLKTTYMP